jgi:NSS family neurotransmitter:Na+ symporter
MSSPRGQWSSKLGFIFAAAGSAIGLGNIWRFPYITGQNGGAAFVFVYLICVFIIGLPILLTELAMGRYTQKNPVGAFEAIRPKTPWKYVGLLGVITGVAILSYYAVIAGWTLGYIFKILFSVKMEFGAFIASPWISIPLFAAFLLLTIFVVYGGVENGIEKWSKLLMPVLLVLLILIIIRSVTLPGAMAGIEFYLNPDFSKITMPVVISALGQAFFSVSLGMGLMITYGSYIGKEDNLISSGFWVAVFDTLIAILAGLMIFPAVFALGKDPAGGPQLVFNVLPEIFEQMHPLGSLIGGIFFLLLAIAALTSTISLLEIPTAYIVDEKKIHRKAAVWYVGILAFIVGLPSAMSQGMTEFWTNFGLLPESLAGGNDFLTEMDFLFGNFSLAFGALMTSVFVGWIWKTENAVKELLQGAPGFARYAPLYSVMVKYIAPIFILLILINLFWGMGS